MQESHIRNQIMKEGSAKARYIALSSSGLAHQQCNILGYRISLSYGVAWREWGDNKLRSLHNGLRNLVEFDLKKQLELME
jgi:hypothetical protein